VTGGGGPPRMLLALVISDKTWLLGCMHACTVQRPVYSALGRWRKSFPIIGDERAIGQLW